MRKRRTVPALAVCVGLFLIAVLFSVTLTAEPQGTTEHTAAVILSEVLSSNESYPTSDGQLLDFIELYNASASAVDISGYMLGDRPDSVGYTFPKGTVLDAGARIVCWCSRDSGSDQYADFGISRQGGDTLCLYNSANVLIDEFTVPAAQANTPFIRVGDSWITAEYATPGYENTEEGYQTWLADYGFQDPGIRISEVMTANRSTLRGQAGTFCDWVELYNPTEQPVCLDGLFLSDDPAEPLRFALPDVTLEAGEYLVIPCAGALAGEGEANFSLSREGCTLGIYSAVGSSAEQTQVPYMEEDRSWSLQEDGSYAVSDTPSPGYPNTDRGSEEFRNTQRIDSPLIISEVMASNSGYMIQNDGKYYDWVELRNITDTRLRLSDYALSNDPDEPHKYVLPDVTLEPGGYIVIICSGDSTMTDSRYYHAPFTVSREEDWIYLTRVDQIACADFICLRDVPSRYSVGRTEGSNATFYFTAPTPGSANGTGVAFISDTPQVLTAEGIYNGVEQVSVEVAGQGQIRYTTDGSVPDGSATLYTGPISLTETTALRFVAMEEGKLTSETVTAVYIINEDHTLPVVSVVAEPEELTGSGGIYKNYKEDREIACNLKLFEENGSFSVDCGIKMHGHTGLQAPKKSFKVNFRGSYGEKYLTYPVYGEEGPAVYDSLIIRSGQDYPTSIFRDELFTSLARDMSDSVLAQRDKFSILYVNGKYYGIYCIKEAWTELMYANNMGGSAENVEIVQAPVGSSSEIYALFQYCRKNDLTQDEHYQYVCDRVDIESLIDWMIIEGYSTNGDVQQNLRYVRSADTGNKWQFCLYDLDWSFYYHNGFKHVLSPSVSWQHMALTRNIIKNPEFRAQFLARCSELMATTLSNENVTARIDYYEALLTPEVTRDRERWGGSLSLWQSKVQYLRNFINIGSGGEDQMDNLINKLIDYIGLTDQEIEKYFSRWR